MKRISITSKDLFKLTVAILAVPGILGLIIASLACFLWLGGWRYSDAGIGSFTFALSPLEVWIIIALALALLIFLGVAARRALARLQGR
jgi:hypothetical protein